MANFRQQFITKCVGAGEKTGNQEANEAGLMEMLAGPSDVDLYQLKSFVWRHNIPVSCRSLLYKTLLGIASPYPETRHMVDKHRKDEAEVLGRCLVQIRQFQGQVVKTDDEQLLLKPTLEDIVRMVLLTEDKLSAQPVTQKLYSPRNAEEQKRMKQIAAIARQVLTLKENWWDNFHITRSLYKLVQTHIPPAEWAKLVKEIRDQAISSPTLNNPKVPIKFNSEALIRNIKSEVIETWLACAGCELLREERATQRFLDKLCIGTHTVLLVKNLIIEFIAARVLHMQENPTSGAFEKLAEEVELKIVARAIEAGFKEQFSKAGRVDQRQRYSYQ
ncbi:hypothetical protein WR25_26895 [Diploscapter pachys]|uniref:Uncharacterized protein n=1 Tax=Diploscapter pachys TaxID=2018661 RepID=A0A2A2J7K1_9BILA|nr:hypothetical protein WR25_26895 [Diploscapter pachys]